MGKGNIAGAPTTSDDDDGTIGVSAGSKKINQGSNEGKQLQALIRILMNNISKGPNWSPKDFGVLSNEDLVLIKSRASFATDVQKRKAGRLLDAKKAQNRIVFLNKMEKLIEKFSEKSTIEDNANSFSSSTLHVATWNMNGGKDKWGSLVGQLKKYDFICLQECGQFPASMVPLEHPDRWIGTGTKDDVSSICALGRWNGLAVLWVHTGGAAGKVESAILTPHKLTGMGIVNSKHVTARCAVGLEIANKIRCYSFHAWSKGGAGNDAESMISAVSNENPSSPIRRWLLAGDFNRQPDNLDAGKLGQTEYTLATTDTATRPNSKKYYDYVIAGWAKANITGKAVPDVQAYSDHNPALFSLSI